MNDDDKPEDGCGIATLLMLAGAVIAVVILMGLSQLERDCTNCKGRIEQSQKEVQELRDNGKQ